MQINLTTYIEQIQSLVAHNDLLELVKTIWEKDRPFTQSSVHATGRFLHSRFREWGIRARTYELPADGQTVIADWKMPLAWECSAATLEIQDPFEERGKVLANRKQQPLHVVYGSGALPEGKIAELIKLDTAENLAEVLRSAKGKYALCTFDPTPHKKVFAKAGIEAVIVAWSPVARQLPQAIAWMRCWADRSWERAQFEGDSALPAVVISPEAGVALEVLLERGRVRLKLSVEAAAQVGSMPMITGYIDGTLQEEIVVLAPLGEPGASASAAGAAIVAETLRVLQKINTQNDSKSLKKTLRGVRGLLGPSGYATHGFAAQNPGIMRRFIAGINLASLGRHQENVEARITHFENPDANASVTDTLLEMLLEAWHRSVAPHARIARSHWQRKDNLYADPHFGMPCPALIGNDLLLHTSADSMDLIEIKHLRAVATLSVAYVHFLASATHREALWLAHQTVKRFSQRMETLATRYALEISAVADDAAAAALLAQATEALDYLKEIGSNAVLSAKQFLLKEERAQFNAQIARLQRHLRRLADLEVRRLKELCSAEAAALGVPAELGELAELRPLRRFLGTPAYESLAPDMRRTIEAPWTQPAVDLALFWSDGKLTFAEIVRRVGYELDRDVSEILVRHFRFMAEHRLIQWLQAGEAIPKVDKTVKVPRSHRKVEAGSEDDEVPGEEEIELAEDAQSELEAEVAGEDALETEDDDEALTAQANA